MQLGAVAAGRRCSGTRSQRGGDAAGRGRSGAEMQRDAAAAGCRCSWAQPQRGGDAAGRGGSGVKMQLGAAAAGRRCGGARPVPSAPHGSVPLSAAFRSKRDGESEGSLPNPSFLPLSLSLSHLLTVSFPSKRPHLPSPQPTSSSLYGPSQSPHPPTSPLLLSLHPSLHVLCTTPGPLPSLLLTRLLFSFCPSLSPFLPQ
jgi:hypothetical protein